MAKIETNSNPDYVWADRRLYVFFRRARVLGEHLKKGGFTNKQINAALTCENPISKEKPAAWLRAELQALRDAEKKGQHPGRRGKTLSRMEIADLAFALLESTNCTGQQLLMLIKELLNVDRRRSAPTAESEKHHHAIGYEALSTLQGQPCGVRIMARHLHISASSISQWKKSPEYRKRVEFYQSCWKERLSDYVETICARFPGIDRRHAFRLSLLVDFLGAKAQEPNSLREIGSENLRVIIAALKQELKLPPISLFWPDNFLKAATKDVERERDVMLRVVTEVLGDPSGKIGGKAVVRSIST